MVARRGGRGRPARTVWAAPDSIAARAASAPDWKTVKWTSPLIPAPSTRAASWSREKVSSSIPTVVSRGGGQVGDQLPAAVDRRAAVDRQLQRGGGEDPDRLRPPQQRPRQRRFFGRPGDQRFASVMGEVGERVGADREQRAVAGATVGEEVDQRLGGAAGDAFDDRVVAAEFEPGGGAVQHRATFVAGICGGRPDRHRRGPHRRRPARGGERRAHEVGDDVPSEKDKKDHPKHPAEARLPLHVGQFRPSPRIRLGNS